MFSYFCAGSISPGYGMVISTSVLLKDNVYCQYQESAITAWKIESGIFLSWTQNCAFEHVFDCFCPYQLVSTTCAALPKKKKVSSTVFDMLSDAEWWDNSYSTCIRHYQLFGDVEFGQSAWQTLYDILVMALLF